MFIFNKMKGSCFSYLSVLEIYQLVIFTFLINSFTTQTHCFLKTKLLALGNLETYIFAKLFQCELVGLRSLSLISISVAEKTNIADD